MPLRDSIADSHVLAAASAKESTLEILKTARPQKEAAGSHRPASSFIEDVDAWVQQYLDLADEVLQTPPEAAQKKKSVA
jgi:hypothetical protein